MTNGVSDLTTLKGYFTIDRDTIKYPVDTRFFSYNSVGVYTNISEGDTQTVTYGTTYNLQVIASAPVVFTLKLGWTSTGAAYACNLLVNFFGILALLYFNFVY